MNGRGLDDYIAAVEHGDFRGLRHDDPDIMRLEENALVEAGLLDPDQPTRWSHHQGQRRLYGDFSPEERAYIRLQLGMVN